MGKESRWTFRNNTLLFDYFELA